MNETKITYKSLVKNHMKAYIRSNYEKTKESTAKSVIAKVGEPEQVLLESNRVIFSKYIKNYPWCAPGDMMSSKNIKLDFFLPHVQDTDNLKDVIKHEIDIKKITFMKRVYDQTCIDLLLKDIENNKIAIKVGFTDTSFSSTNNKETLKKEFGRYYYRINHLMTKKLVTAEDFCKNDLLFRYILNTFLNTHGEKSTLILLYPKANEDLHNSSKEFYKQLKSYYGFKHVDRVKLLHFENLPMSQSFMNKYINIRSKSIILTVKQKNHVDYYLKNATELKSLLVKLNESKRLNIKVIDNLKDSIGLFTSTIAVLNENYDLYSDEDRIDKVYEESKKVNIDLQLQNVD